MQNQQGQRFSSLPLMPLAPHKPIKTYMGIFTKAFMALAVTGAVTLSAQAAVSSHKAVTRFDAASHLYKAKNSSNVFRSSRMDNIARINAMLEQPAAQYRRTATGPDGTISPSFTLGPATKIGDLDAPNGELWFYTMTFTYIDEYFSEFYTAHWLETFTLNVYDANGKLQGTVHDKIQTRGNETHPCLCDVTPVITRNFFNTDDKWEIAMGEGFNTPQYVNQYRTLVYQLNGETNADGTSKCVYEFPHLVCDVLDASEGGKEKFYISTAHEGSHGVIDNPQEGTEDYWNNMKAYNTQITCYAPAVDNQNGPREIFTHQISIQQLPGNQDTTPYFMTQMIDGRAIAMVSYYKDTLWNPIYSTEQDITQREGNMLVASLYEIKNDKFEKFQQTEVPCPVYKEAGIIGTYYGVGDMRYHEDISFKNYGATPQKASIVVTSDQWLTTEDGANKCYYAYDGDGNLVTTLFTNAEASISMSDIPGQEPQQLFVENTGSEWIFHFVDLLSGKERCKFNCMVDVEDGDPEMLTSNLDRTAVGDSYMYVDELRYPVEDGENSYLRFAWLDDKGKLSHIDEFNMGTNVKYAKSFINGVTLNNPSTFWEGDEQEFMVLVKRGLSTGDREELLIGQCRSEAYPEGRNLLYVDSDLRGDLLNIAPYSFMGVPKLMIGFYDRPNSAYVQDYYNLPLGHDAGVDNIVADGDTDAPAIAFDGATVTADGLITVYTTAGMKVASANDNLDASRLPAGVYVAACGRSSIKIAVK